MFNTKLGLMGVVALTAALVGCGGDPAPPAAAPVGTAADAQEGAQDQGDVVIDDFTEPLGNYGTWVDDATYGKVWQPADDVAGEDFVPYTSDGTWVANDDGGWVFESKYDTEWGWATYHYGRWYEHEDYGWVWAPATAWAPSWVDWRDGGGYVGWAPMGPEGVVINENRWLFVEERHMGDPGGSWSFRVQPERIHAVFTAAAPIERGGGGGKWSVGPSSVKIKAAGGSFKSKKASAPSRSAVKAAGKASVAKAASSNRPKRAANAPPATRRGPNTKAGPVAKASAAKEPAGKEPAGKEPAGKEPKGGKEPAGGAKSTHASAAAITPTATTKPKPQQAAPPPTKKAPPPKKK